MVFRRQLLTGCSAFLAIAVAMTTLTVVSLHRIGGEVARVAHRYTDKMVTVERVRFQAERLIATARGYVVMRGAVQLGRLTAATSELDTSLRELSATDLTPDSADDLRAIYEDAHAYDGAAREVTKDDPRAERTFERLLGPQRTSLQERVDSLARRERATFETELARSRDRAERAGVVVAAAGLAGLMLTLLLATAVLRHLTRLYDRQRKAIDEARRSAAAREEILAMVSHDLRNPLGTVVAASDLLVMKLAGTTMAQEVGRDAATIQAAAERMTHLVDQILETAKIDAGTLHLELGACDAAGLVRTALDMFDARAHQASVLLRCRIPSEPLIVHADKERVIQVVANLVGNALKFTRPGDIVEARASPVGGAVQFDIEDTGRGIPADQLGQLFERFWQGSPTSSSRGIGLGLYICKKLVEAHGGRIWVDSRPGEGTCFHFTLPRSSC